MNRKFDTKLIPQQADFCGKKVASNNQTINTMYYIKKEDNKRGIRGLAEQVKL